MSGRLHGVCAQVWFTLCLACAFAAHTMVHSLFLSVVLYLTCTVWYAQLLGGVGPVKEVQLRLAQLYCLVGRPELALPVARSAVEQHPEDPMMHVLLASCLVYALLPACSTCDLS